MPLEPSFIPLAALAPFLGFVVLWVLILNGVAVISGWKKLHQQLGSFVTPPIAGESRTNFLFQSGRFNKARYNNCLTISTTRYALVIKMFGPFSFGHKPLFIPWERVESLNLEEGLLTQTVHLHLASPLNDPITLPAKILLNNSHIPARLALSSSTQPYENPYQ